MGGVPSVTWKIGKIEGHHFFCLFDKYILKPLLQVRAVVI